MMTERDGERERAFSFFVYIILLPLSFFLNRGWQLIDIAEKRKKEKNDALVSLNAKLSWDSDGSTNYDFGE